MVSKWTTTTTTATNQWPWCSTAHGGTASSSAGRMHIVRAQAVELDWMWQRRSDATTSQTDARVRQGEQGGEYTKSTEPSSRRHFARDGATGRLQAGQKASGMAGREVENLKMARLKCCILLLLQPTAACVCVAWAGGSWSDCNAG